jgi:sporulation protein YlmC with PRC-barrel domain
MRTIPLAVAALALLSAAASAQTTPTSPSRPSPATPSATQPAPAQPAVNPLTKEHVSNIQGQNVYGSDDAKLGSVSEILMDPQTKKLDKLVVSTGGVMGIGSHRVAIPLDQFSWDGQKAGFKLTKNAEALKAMPEWVEGATTTGSSTAPARTTGSSEPPAKTTAPTGGGNNSK